MSQTDAQTAGDLMSIAWRTEQEAARRYARLARAMHSYGNRETAALFERMAEEERAHERLIEEWAGLEGIRLRSDIDPIACEDPQVSTEYDDEAVDPVLSTPYRALAFAVHNKECAFGFYTRVAAMAEDAAVCRYAEILAREECGHAALLRTMRRRAWRAERETGHDEPHIDPSVVQTLADLVAVATGAELCLAENQAALADSYPELQRFGDATGGALADISAALDPDGRPGRDAVAAVQSIERYKGTLGSLGGDKEALLQRLYSDSDRCFTFYDAIVTHSEDESVMLAAQKLSESVLERNCLLREVIRTET